MKEGDPGNNSAALALAIRHGEGALWNFFYPTLGNKQKTADQEECLFVLKRSYKGAGEKTFLILPVASRTT